jgi:hypothetical protein
MVSMRAPIVWCLLGMALSAGTVEAQVAPAQWIWYPGDLDIWLGNLVQARRVERTASLPPFWRMDSPYAMVVFTKRHGSHRQDLDRVHGAQHSLHHSPHRSANPGRCLGVHPRRHAAFRIQAGDGGTSGGASGAQRPKCPRGLRAGDIRFHPVESPAGDRPPEPVLRRVRGGGAVRRHRPRPSTASRSRRPRPAISRHLTPAPSAS